MDELPVEWVVRAQRRDESAFAELLRRFERSALGIAYAVLGDASAAGDVTQEAFLRAWQRLDELNDPARFAAWFGRIVRNLAADHARRRPRYTAGADAIDAAGNDVAARHVADPVAELDRAELRGRIDAALAGLDELTRSAVVLRYYQNLSSKQIAQLLELSPAAVDMRLSRARAELRQKLAPAVEPDASLNGA